MTDETYKQHMGTMPEDHLSQEFLDELVRRSTSDGTFLEWTNKWVTVKNLKFYNGLPDPKYAYAIKDHHTFFSREPAQWVDELSPYAKIEMLKLMGKYQRRGWYVYTNATVHRSIRRFHWHAIKWDTSEMAERKEAKVFYNKLLDKLSTRG